MALDSAVGVLPFGAALPFKPPAPTPRQRPLDLIGLLAALRRNPLETWTMAHFNEPIVVREMVIGRRAVVSDPDAVRRVLVDNASNYRKDDLQRRVLSPGLGDGLLTAEGRQWRQQRRALAPLFTPRNVGAFVPAMATAAETVCGRWLRKRDGRRIDVAVEMGRVTLDVLERTIFSDGIERDPQAFARQVARYFNTIGRIDPLDLLGFPDWIPRIGRIRGREPLRFFDQAVRAIVATRRERLKAGAGSVPRDLLTLLMEAADPNTGEGLTEAEIRANIMTFIGAGHETTANTLTWSLFLLASAPEVRETLEAEVDREFPEGAEMTAAVLDRLVATRAVIEEALRLYPPAAILSRAAIGADDLAGVRIRAGTLVVIAPWVLHRHRLLWDEPDLFKPWRFLPGAREAIPRFAYLPFGAGPRVCIGASFALQEATIILATILRTFRLDRTPEHDVTPIQRVTLKPKGGMPMFVRRRMAGALS